MFLERGIDVSYETIRRWVAKFGPSIARGLRRKQPRSGDIWHLDEVVVKIKGRKFWLWRAVDEKGIVLDEILQRRRDKKAAKGNAEISFTGKSATLRINPLSHSKLLLRSSLPSLCINNPLSPPRSI